MQTADHHKDTQTDTLDHVQFSCSYTSRERKTHARLDETGWGTFWSKSPGFDQKGVVQKAVVYVCTSKTRIAKPHLALISCRTRSHVTTTAKNPSPYLKVFEMPSRPQVIVVSLAWAHSGQLSWKLHPIQRSHMGLPQIAIHTKTMEASIPTVTALGKLLCKVCYHWTRAHARALTHTHSLRCITMALARTSAPLHFSHVCDSLGFSGDAAVVRVAVAAASAGMQGPMGFIRGWEVTGSRAGDCLVHMHGLINLQAPKRPVFE
mmetsp:Transcript_150856/g.263662  ORF Transcript_150856/g.263662 Transcript_150856/m.263662 type:complete len:263 (-) Transcript_150856:634-1422(-)